MKAIKNSLFFMSVKTKTAAANAEAQPIISVDSSLQFPRSLGVSEARELWLNEQIFDTAAKIMSGDDEAVAERGTWANQDVYNKVAGLAANPAEAFYVGVTAVLAVQHLTEIADAQIDVKNIAAQLTAVLLGNRRRS